MIHALTLILSCQLAGELAVRYLGLPVPGPVLGMLLLLAWLFIKGGVSENLEKTTSDLLEHLSLLFVPAGVGVIVHWEAIRNEWQALTLALVASTVIALAVTSLTMLGIRHLSGRGKGEIDG